MLLLLWYGDNKVVLSVHVEVRKQCPQAEDIQWTTTGHWSTVQGGIGGIEPGQSCMDDFYPSVKD